jgi:hypothetical protein
MDKILKLILLAEQLLDTAIKTSVALKALHPNVSDAELLDLRQRNEAALKQYLETL